MVLTYWRDSRTWCIRKTDISRRFVPNIKRCQSDKLNSISKSSTGRMHSCLSSNCSSISYLSLSTTTSNSIRRILRIKKIWMQLFSQVRTSLTSISISSGRRSVLRRIRTTTLSLLGNSFRLNVSINSLSRPQLLAKNKLSQWQCFSRWTLNC